MEPSPTRRAPPGPRHATGRRGRSPRPPGPCRPRARSEGPHRSPGRPRDRRARPRGSRRCPDSHAGSRRPAFPSRGRPPSCGSWAPPRPGRAPGGGGRAWDRWCSPPLPCPAKPSRSPRSSPSASARRRGGGCAGGRRRGRGAPFRRGRGRASPAPGGTRSAPGTRERASGPESSSGTRGDRRRRNASCDLSLRARMPRCGNPGGYRSPGGAASDPTPARSGGVSPRTPRPGCTGRRAPPSRRAESGRARGHRGGGAAGGRAFSPAPG